MRIALHNAIARTQGMVVNGYTNQLWRYLVINTLAGAMVALAPSQYSAADGGWPTVAR